MDHSDQAPEITTEYMEALLGHYLKQHQIVLKQLEHAKNATLKSIDDINAIRERFEINETIRQFENIHQLNNVWGDVIRLCKNAGLDEQELAILSRILNKVPRPIRQDYDEMVQKDHELKQMIQEINAPENIAKREAANNYKNDMHRQVNDFMGVDEAEYDAFEDTLSSVQKEKLEKVYKIFVDSE